MVHAEPGGGGAVWHYGVGLAAWCVGLGGGGVARAGAVIRDVRPVHLPVCGPYLCHAIAVFAYLLVFIVFYFSVVCKLSLSASGRYPNPSTLASPFVRLAPDGPTVITSPLMKSEVGRLCRGAVT